METIEIDLFDKYELLPPNALAILEKYEDFDFTYDECRAMLADFEAIGYTFEYYLDAQPHSLRKIKEYNLDILTEQGPKTVFFTDLQPIEETEKAIVLKYGTFTTLKCTQL